ncbi:MAG TPA: four helix bundle protein [Myxococcota bacterium]|nr:four helix bundle protein [Myxococcota bacterium]
MTRGAPDAASQAPIYKVSYDLSRLILERVETLEPVPLALWGAPLAAHARDLLEHITLALTFPKGRYEHLTASDYAVARLRVALRLAADRGLISPGWHRLVHGQLATIGRMIGGWRRQEARAPPDPG